MKNFQPQKMVGWYNVKQLAGTAIRSILSSIFGSRADKRETLAAITEQEVYDLDRNQPELWLDYISDTGDGFDATFSMMKLIAQEKIVIENEKGTFELKRGNLVVFGGDQVYPAPTQEEYLNRFIGPLEAASAEIGEEKTELYAIPGNHDWYDGLSNFVEIFCRRKTIGGYKTIQNRSYFAIKLTDNTWLWGIDIQLSASIDDLQIEYFNYVAKSEMKAGNNVILCTAEPSWVHYNVSKEYEKYKNMAEFEQQCILANGLVHNLTLTGDLHHYARYTQFIDDKPTKHKITAGGGGAFLHPTHNLPEQLSGMHEGNFELQETFPKVKTSKRLAFRNFLFPWYNIGFGLFLSSIHLVLAYALYTTSLLDPEPGSLFGDFAQTSEIFTPEIWRRLMWTFFYSPPAILILLTFIVGFYSFTDKKASRFKSAGFFGALHGAVHIYLMLVAFSSIAYFTEAYLGIRSAEWGILAIGLQVFVIGGLVSGILVGLYLVISNLVFKMHDNEAFSSLKIKGYKNFMRIHIKNNKLTIYPIGVKKTSKWHKVGSVFKTNNPMTPMLIDEPIVIDL
ncbi:MAG: metallophosphoesterase [Bacteroidetes bacterium]|nr:metallophosphoesterase [Bacteroidota bacterium]